MNHTRCKMRSVELNKMFSGWQASAPNAPIMKINFQLSDPLNLTQIVSDLKTMYLIQQVRIVMTVTALLRTLERDSYCMS